MKGDHKHRPSIGDTTWDNVIVKLIAWEKWALTQEKELKEMQRKFEFSRWKSGSGFYRARLAREVLKEVLGE